MRRVIVGILVTGLCCSCASTSPEQKELRRHSLRVEKKLQAIILPEINRHEADIHDVVEFLVAAGHDNDPERRDFNLIMNIGDSDPPKISFNARHVSLLNAIKTVTEVADLEYRIDKDVIIILPKRYN